MLTETLAEYPLIQMIQLSFSYSLFFEAEIYKFEIFKNLAFAKMSTRKIRFFVARKNKYTQILVHYRYAVFLFELRPLPAFPRQIILYLAK